MCISFMFLDGSAPRRSAWTWSRASPTKPPWDRLSFEVDKCDKGGESSSRAPENPPKNSKKILTVDRAVQHFITKILDLCCQFFSPFSTAIFNHCSRPVQVTVQEVVRHSLTAVFVRTIHLSSLIWDFQNDTMIRERRIWFDMWLHTPIKEWAFMF